MIVAAVAGGLGAVSRYLLDVWVGRLARGRFPAGTAVVNVTGSFALGALVGGGEGLIALVGAAFLGGYTTFSTYANEVAHLLTDGAPALGVLHAVGGIAAGVLAAAAGLALTSAL